jgi:hypothetical protein
MKYFTSEPKQFETYARTRTRTQAHNRIHCSSISGFLVFDDHGKKNLHEEGCTWPRKTKACLLLRWIDKKLENVQYIERDERSSG